MLLLDCNPSVFGPMCAWLMLALNPPGPGLADLADTRPYWKEQKVAFAAGSLARELRVAPVQALSGPPIHDLIAALGASRHEEREAAESALRARAEEAHEALRLAAKGDDPEVAARAARLLGQTPSGGISYRDLLVVRGLDQLRAGDQAPLLEGLAASTSPAAGYARRVLLHWRNEPVAAPNVDARMAAAVRALPPVLSAAGMHRLPARRLETPIRQRFQPAGFFTESDTAYIRGLGRQAAGLLETMGDIHVHGFTFGLGPEAPGCRALYLVVVADYAPGSMRATLRKHATGSLRSAERQWFQLGAEVAVSAEGDGQIRLTLHDTGWLTSWTSCPEGAPEDPRLPGCWPVSLRTRAAQALRGGAATWMATADESASLWNWLPALAPYDGGLLQAAPAGTNDAWRVQLDLQAPQAVPDAEESVRKFEAMRRAAVGSAANLDAFAPIAEAFTHSEMRVEDRALHYLCSGFSPDALLNALPLMRMFMGGL